MTELSQTIIGLESKLLEFETDNRKYKEDISNLQVLLHRSETTGNRLSAERDSLMRRNENLHTLLEAAAVLIVDGLRKLDADNALSDAVAQSLRPLDLAEDKKPNG